MKALFIRHTVLVVAVLFVISACGEPQQAKPLSDIGLLTLNGSKEPLSKWRGKTLILNVWATWCAPCRKEMPELQKLSERLDPEQFQVLGVSVDKNPILVKEFLRENGITFARHIDPDKKITRGLLGITRLPQTIVIDSQKIIRDRHIGARNWSLVDFSKYSHK